MLKAGLILLLGVLITTLIGLLLTGAGLIDRLIHLFRVRGSKELNFSQNNDRGT